ncbi:hypothetical protein FNF29_04571 [Cafeteria roenbergensis]|uniref:Protein kinase domain-containing protein n=1 Tax=Cafeteria roenbergensis TaxID=33653 RepID=A0A5A8CEH2_CAFRO|nr:hypothetical protein FNF29_04571 [Cafeteria roenbergensis]|eukprot:KAA0151372.1 hypothetical protein FNF29_04571 [Cafeteria roenbergensis]
MDTDSSMRVTPSCSYSYCEGSVLGERGGEGEVFRGTCKRSGHSVAVKVFHSPLSARIPEHTPDVCIRRGLESAGWLKAARELMVLPLAWEQDERRSMLVLPLMNCGDLLDDTRKRFADGRAMCEEDARKLAGRLLRATVLLHELGWGHMDIKLENVLLHDGEAFLADFGHAKPTSRPVVRRARQAMPNPRAVNFMAPERFRQSVVHVKPCDVWAIGACILAVLTGTGVDVSRPDGLVLPFQAGTLSAECLNFLGQSMDFDPDRRATADQLLAHPWLAEPAAAHEASFASSSAAASGAAAPQPEGSPAWSSTHSRAAAASASAAEAASARCTSGETDSTEDSDVE